MINGFNNTTFTKLREFDNHEMVAFLHDEKTNLMAFVAIHRKKDFIPSFGATRFWKYTSSTHALRDALRLSHLMSYKSALAGLPYGGAKGVIIDTSHNPRERRNLLKTYANKLNHFAGSFITGTDVGLNHRDLAMMDTITQYVVGRHCDPAEFTAYGVVRGIQTCLKSVYKNEHVSGRRFAIQGAGKVGMWILKLIYRDASEIYVSDISRERLALLAKRYPRVHIISSKDIHKQEVDVFVPCALNGSLNGNSIRQLNCRIIAGGANNQLNTPETGDKLHELGILYAPDYIINSGGLVAVTDEYTTQRFNKERVMNNLQNISQILREVIRKSKEQNTSPNRVATTMAKKIVNG